MFSAFIAFSFPWMCVFIFYWFLVLSWFSIRGEEQIFPRRYEHKVCPMFGNLYQSLRHVNCGVVYSESSYKITLSINYRSLNRSEVSWKFPFLTLFTIEDQLLSKLQKNFWIFTLHTRTPSVTTHVKNIRERNLMFQTIICLKISMNMQ